MRRPRALRLTRRRSRTTVIRLDRRRTVYDLHPATTIKVQAHRLAISHFLRPYQQQATTERPRCHPQRRTSISNRTLSPDLRASRTTCRVIRSRGTAAITVSRTTRLTCSRRLCSHSLRMTPALVFSIRPTRSRLSGRPSFGSRQRQNCPLARHRSNTIIRTRITDPKPRLHRPSTLTTVRSSLTLTGPPLAPDDNTTTTKGVNRAMQLDSFSPPFFILRTLPATLASL